MRGRAWRRHIEEKKVIHRLESMKHYHWWGFTDVNGNVKERQRIGDYIGKYESFKFKTYTTSSSDSKYKSKYSPNKGKQYWRNGSECREKEKVIFLKILKEYGIK